MFQQSIEEEHAWNKTDSFQTKMPNKKPNQKVEPGQKKTRINNEAMDISKFKAHFIFKQ